MVVECHSAKCDCSRNDKGQQNGKYFDVAFHHCQGGKNSQDNQCDYTVHFGEYPRGKSGGIDVYDFHQKVFLDILQNGEKEVGEEKQCQYGSKAAEQVPALLFVKQNLNYRGKYLYFICLC